MYADLTEKSQVALIDISQRVTLVEFSRAHVALNQKHTFSCGHPTPQPPPPFPSAVSSKGTAWHFKKSVILPQRALTALGVLSLSSPMRVASFIYLYFFRFWSYLHQNHESWRRTHKHSNTTTIHLSVFLSLRQRLLNVEFYQTEGLCTIIHSSRTHTAGVSHQKHAQLWTGLCIFISYVSSTRCNRARLQQGGSIHDVLILTIMLH